MPDDGHVHIWLDQAPDQLFTVIAGAECHLRLRASRPQGTPPSIRRMMTDNSCHPESMRGHFARLETP
jgi:hypothetical protein